MATMAFEELVQAAQQLDAAHKFLLIERLLSTAEPTLDELDAKRQRLLSEGAFAHVETLYGRFAVAETDLDENALNETLRDIRDVWKEDLDELSDTQF